MRYMWGFQIGKLVNSEDVVDKRFLVAYYSGIGKASNIY